MSRIFKLLRNPGSRVFSRDLLGPIDGAAHAFRGGREHQLGAENGERERSLAVVREHDQVVAPEGCTQGFKLGGSLPGCPSCTSLFGGNEEPRLGQACRLQRQAAAIVVADFEKVEAAPAHPVAIALYQFEDKLVNAVLRFESKVCEEAALADFFGAGHCEP